MTMNTRTSNAFSCVVAASEELDERPHERLGECAWGCVTFRLRGDQRHDDARRHDGSHHEIDGVEADDVGEN